VSSWPVSAVAIAGWVTATAGGVVSLGLRTTLGGRSLLDSKTASPHCQPQRVTRSCKGRCRADPRGIVRPGARARRKDRHARRPGDAGAVPRDTLERSRVSVTSRRCMGWRLSVFRGNRPRFYPGRRAGVVFPGGAGAGRRSSGIARQRPLHDRVDRCGWQWATQFSSRRKGCGLPTFVLNPATHSSCGRGHPTRDGDGAHSTTTLTPLLPTMFGWTRWSSSGHDAAGVASPASSSYVFSWEHRQRSHGCYVLYAQAFDAAAT